MLIRLRSNLKSSLKNKFDDFLGSSLAVVISSGKNCSSASSTSSVVKSIVSGCLRGIGKGRIILCSGDVIPDKKLSSVGSLACCDVCSACAPPVCCCLDIACLARSCNSVCIPATLKVPKSEPTFIGVELLDDDDDGVFCLCRST